MAGNVAGGGGADNAGGGTAERTDSLQRAMELLQSSTKWLAASLGAIGAILVAGSQLSSIGSLENGVRLWIAIGGLSIGLGAVLWSIWRVVALLTPEGYTINRLADEWTVASPVLKEGVRGRWRRRKYHVIDFFAKNDQYLGNQGSMVTIRDRWYHTSSEDIGPINDLTNRVIRLANYRAAFVQFQRSRKWMTLAVMLAAAGIGLFAWAANPETPEQPPATLKGALLFKANLSGANLKNADLTRANLTNANLRGSTLTGATITNVVWSNTVCPDGVNSRATVMKVGKKKSAETCEGHLTP